MTFNSSDREQILRHLNNIIRDTLQDSSIDVYLFGSWARHEGKKTSDIDIALSADTSIPT
ncbi:nucleotidyltransferase domain-containing protein [Tenuibacillus multivorans]|uniref:nucleotidyltransferase domain-containing protein n=1 Tax=Tenuibacillus multivorans TaxID=237069 RepID=UPI0011747BD2|nr:nucleotidyltransferase domain-containing protein [Tenuibacillus multivorans]GEL77682.1 hypothetical protein TMU01_19170 [Tenuibacillus multivorans]